VPRLLAPVPRILAPVARLLVLRQRRVDSLSQSQILVRPFGDTPDEPRKLPDHFIGNKRRRVPARDAEGVECRFGQAPKRVACVRIETLQN